MASKRTDAYADLRKVKPFSFSNDSEYRCKPGICVFIINTEFTELDNVEIGNNDEESIKFTFQKLGFVVKVHLNLTAAEIESIAKEYSAMEHSGAFFLIITSHGGPYNPKCHIMDDAICGTDAVSGTAIGKVKVHDLKEHFYATKCPSLAGIPKVFMINACRGSEYEGFLNSTLCNSEFQDFSSSSTTQATHVMNAADIMTIFASTQGHVAGYDKNEGTYLIQTFAKVLEEASIDDNLTDINNKVKRIIKERKIQTIEVNSTFDKYYYIKRQYSTPQQSRQYSTPRDSIQKQFRPDWILQRRRYSSQIYKTPFEQDFIRQFDRTPFWQDFIRQDSTPTISVTEIEQFITHLHSKLPGIANAFGGSVTEVQGLVQEAKYELDEICECSEVRRVYEVKVSYQHLNSAVEAVYIYLDKVDDLFWKLNNKTAAVIQDIKEEDFESVVQLIVEINKTTRDCKEQCVILLERCQEFANSCDRAERECRRLEREAEEKQLRARVAGGVTTAGVAAAGTTASILVGVFTFGIGTVIGVPLTLAATAATTTAAGAATIYFSHKYGKAADAFGKISRRFKRLRSNIDTTQDRVTGIMSLPGINVVLNENVEITCATSAQCSSLAETLQTTLDESTSLYRQTSSGRRIAANSKDSLHDKYQSVY